ncbi:hypothetical protein JCM21900_000419 [Sporobolomyces salmonicolor]
MSTNTSGAGLSRSVVLVLCSCSLLAALTTTQHYFNVPLTPHLTRDHQLYRFALRWLVWRNSSQLVIAAFVLWYASLDVERIWGSRKYASFLVVMAGLTTVLEALSLVLFSHAGLRILPAGPFALTFAVVYQSHRLLPTLYHFQLLHSSLTLNNRFPLYLLSLLLLTSEPPSSVLLCLIGLLSSMAYSSDALPLSLRQWRIPQRVYDTLAQALGPLMGVGSAQSAPVRGTAVTPEEAMLQSLGLGNGGAGGPAASAAGMFDVRAVRRRMADRPTPARRGGDAAANALTESPPAVPALPLAAAATVETRWPHMTGTSFLQQWQAGLSGGQAAPSSEQIAELSGIFPHATRPAIILALQQNGLNTTRAAEALLTAN